MARICQLGSGEFPAEVKWPFNSPTLVSETVAVFFFLKGIDDEHCFDAEATIVTSNNIQNLKCLYNYKCFVSGGERWFFMGLGVSGVSWGLPYFQRPWQDNSWITN